MASKYVFLIKTSLIAFWALLIGFYSQVGASVPPVDKIMHFEGGVCVQAMMEKWGFTPKQAFFGVLTVAIVKELYDETKPNPTGFDWQDINATLLGAISYEVAGHLVHYDGKKIWLRWEY